jgi:hypothetical protein
MRQQLMVGDDAWFAGHWRVAVPNKCMWQMLPQRFFTPTHFTTPF